VGGEFPFRDAAMADGPSREDRLVQRVMANKWSEIEAMASPGSALVEGTCYSLYFFFDVF